MLSLIFSQLEQISKQGLETKEDSSAEWKTWQVLEKESVEVSFEGVHAEKVSVGEESDGKVIPCRGSEDSRNHQWELVWHEESSG